MPWNKGFTKHTHPSVLKISETMKRKKIDNFSKWRKPVVYKEIVRSNELAEYIGVILGDGNISKFPRTERLILVSNENNKGFIRHYALLTEKLFKRPGIFKVPGAVRISFYEKNISERLGINTGNRKNIRIILPKWIRDNRNYLIHYLKGLFEAEASLCIHTPTSTYNFAFSNRNSYLLGIVFKALQLLGYHPRRGRFTVELRKKVEVLSFKQLIGFREYPLL